MIFALNSDVTELSITTCLVMMNGLRWFPIIAALMAASTLESEAAFKERALQIGIEERHVEKFVEKRFAAFGRYAFAVVYSPHHTDEAPLRRFLTDLLEESPAWINCHACGGCSLRRARWR